MNQNRKEELLTRWIDGVLSEEEGRELAPLLAAHPELERERQAYEKIRVGLKEALPTEGEPPYPDFFNTHLESKVRESMMGAAIPSRGKTVFGWMLGWWLAPVTTAAVVVAFLVGMKVGRPAETAGPLVVGPVPPAAYSPVLEVTAEAHLDEALDAVVIVLDGLEDLSDQEFSVEHRSGRRPVAVMVTNPVPNGL